ncbi:ATP-dependent DNA helicase Hel308 [uncultured archaeon]|nr:ATP-dependent DNA helicase Hel308 [uncultured archaeon]
MEEIFTKIKPREYQEKIFLTCLERNTLIVLPTGLGKTLIALMVTVQRMKDFPGKKVVFLAPTRPLAEQHLNYFKKNLPELFASMELFTGKVNPPERRKIWQTADIIFSTPQCVANDLKNRLYNLNDVCLLIEDEAHRCVKNYDYTYIAASYKQQAPTGIQRIIGMTASPGSEAQKIKEICKNLSIEEVELRSRISPDVKGYLQELEFEKIIVDFPEDFNKIRLALQKIIDNYIEELRARNVLFGAVNKIKLIELQRSMMASISRGNQNFGYFSAVSACSQAIKLQHALELLETQTLDGVNKYLKGLFDQASKKKSKGVVKLVASTEFNFIFEGVTELIAKGREHPKVEQILEIVKREKQENKNVKLIVFTQFRETAGHLSKKINEISGVTSKVFIGQAKKSNSKGEQTGLSQKEQKNIIEDFSNGKINVICATSIAEEGLDIPEVNAVIFYETIPSAIRAIQRTGRTARLKKGKLILLITKKTRDESNYYVSRSREKKMTSAIETVKKDLINNSRGLSEKNPQKKLF